MVAKSWIKNVEYLYSKAKLKPVYQNSVRKIKREENWEGWNK